MMDHGALKTNYGRKTIVGPDRHQQRETDKPDPLLASAQTRVAKKTEAIKGQQEKVAASASKGHGTRLAQRQRALVGLAQAFQDAQHTYAKLTEQASAMGPKPQPWGHQGSERTVTSARRRS
jgi:hypothetical protein